MGRKECSCQPLFNSWAHFRDACNLRVGMISHHDKKFDLVSRLPGPICISISNWLISRRCDSGVRSLAPRWPGTSLFSSSSPNFVCFFFFFPLFCWTSLSGAVAATIKGKREYNVEVWWGFVLTAEMTAANFDFRLRTGLLPPFPCGFFSRASWLIGRSCEKIADDNEIEKCCTWSKWSWAKYWCTGHRDTLRWVDFFAVLWLWTCQSIFVLYCWLWVNHNQKI